jgi:hypothetical protein
MRRQRPPADDDSHPADIAHIMLKMKLISAQGETIFLLSTPQMSAAVKLKLLSGMNGQHNDGAQQNVCHHHAAVVYNF